MSVADFRSILLPLTFALSYLLAGCLASHFRGASFWWYPTGEPNQITLAFRIAWRRDYSESTACDKQIIEQGELIGPGDAGYIMCVSNCNLNIGNVQFYCTDYSIREDWAAGTREHLVTLPGPGAYKLGWRGRSWLEEVLRGAITDWEFLISVNTEVRQDTGKMNSSPHSAATTILKVQHGCSHSVSIPVFDADNDQVRCRWAKNKECGGICGAPDNIELRRETCTLDMNDQVQQGPYALAIQLEDFSSADSLEPLSSVPLQFLVNVTSLTTEEDETNGNRCNLGPVFIAPTPEDQQCIPILADVEKSIDIVVRTKDAFTGIREINTASFLGVNKTKVNRYGSDPRDFFITVTWLPESDYQGDRIFCFVATDTNGYSSGQRCIYVSVGISAPRAVSAEYRPTQHEIVIQFDQQIQMPRGSHELVVEDDNESQILVLDTSNTDMVSYTDRTLRVSLQSDTVLQGNYSIKLQSGAVRGVMRCGPDSLPVTDANQLKFTAPVVTTSVTGSKSTVTDQTTAFPTTSESENNITSSGNEPSRPVPTPSSGPQTEDKDDYMWLIIVVVVVIFLLLLLILLALLCHKKVNKQKYSRQQRQEEYLKSQATTKVVGYDGPYAPNFHDIEVKFR